MSDNVAFIGTMYAAFGRGDLQTILDNLDPAVSWESNGDPDRMPWGGKRSGLAGARSFFEALGGNLDFELFEPGTFYPSGDAVIVHGQTVARHKTGARGQWRSEWVHIFTLRGGKIVRFQEFYDTAAMERALAG